MGIWCWFQKKSSSFASSFLYMCVCVCVIAEWFIASGAECAFCFSDQYSVADCTGFSVAGSDGKLLLLSVYHTFYCQCSFNHRHSWLTWGKQTPLPISLSLSFSLSPTSSPPTFSISIHCKTAVALTKKCTAFRAPEESNKYTVKSYSCLHNK